MPTPDVYTQREALYSLLADNELALLELEVLLGRAERRERIARFLPYVDDDDVARPVFEFLVRGLEEAAMLRMEALRERHNRAVLTALLDDTWGTS